MHVKHPMAQKSKRKIIKPYVLMPAICYPSTKPAHGLKNCLITMKTSEEWLNDNNHNWCRSRKSWQHNSMYNTVWTSAALAHTIIRVGTTPYPRCLCMIGIDCIHLDKLQNIMMPGWLVPSMGQSGSSQASFQMRKWDIQYNQIKSPAV